MVVWALSDSVKDGGFGTLVVVWAQQDQNLTTDRVVLVTWVEPKQAELPCR